MLVIYIWPILMFGFTPSIHICLCMQQSVYLIDCCRPNCMAKLNLYAGTIHTKTLSSLCGREKIGFPNTHENRYGHTYIYVSLNMISCTRVMRYHSAADTHFQAITVHPVDDGWYSCRPGALESPNCLILYRV